MLFSLFFFFNVTATTEIYTLSLHDALPILILIESEVPEHHAPGPVPRRANHQMDLLLEKISLLPIAAGAFGEPDIFVRKALVQFVLRGDVSAVTMGRGASRKGSGFPSA